MSCLPWRKHRAANSPPSSSRTPSTNLRDRAPKTSCGKTTRPGDQWKSRLILAPRSGYHKKRGSAFRASRLFMPSFITLTWLTVAGRRSTPRWECPPSQARPPVPHRRSPVDLLKALPGQDPTGCQMGMACDHDQEVPHWGRRDRE